MTWKAEIMPSKMTPLLTSPYRGSGGLFSTSSLAYPGFCRCSRGNREWQIRGCERFKFASDTVKMINTVNCNSNGLSLIFISSGKRQITVAMNTVDYDYNQLIIKSSDYIQFIIITHKSRFKMFFKQWAVAIQQGATLTHLQMWLQVCLFFASDCRSTWFTKGLVVLDSSC